MFHIGCDPGKHTVAAAAGEPGRLVWADALTYRNAGPDVLAAFVIASMKASLGERFLKGSRWLVERPRHYADRTSTHADLASLDAVNEALASVVRTAGGRVKFVYPSAWKGNVPKKVCQARLARVLTPHELEAIVSPHDHNTWDAVGIWAVHTGLLKRGLV